VEEVIVMKEAETGVEKEVKIKIKIDYIKMSVVEK